MRAALGVGLQLRYVLEDALNQATRRQRVVQRDVIGNRIEILERRHSPNQLSHRAIRFLA